jgi:DNA uptake protein ComE-like DNA-binding protein
MQRLWLLLATSFLFVSPSKAARLLAGKDDNCGPCLPMANDALGSSCTDAVCVVKAFAKEKDALMAKPDGMDKLMGVYACAQQNKSNLEASSAAGQEAQALGLLKGGAPSFLQVSKANDNCEPCLPLANAALGSSCTDPVCVVKAFAKEKDTVMAQPDGMDKLMGVYACAQQNKCDLSPDSSAGKEAQSLGLLKGAAPSFLQLSASKDNCEPCLPLANAALGSSCTDPVCVVKAFAKEKDTVMAQPDGMDKLMGVYACAQQNKCDLSPNSDAGKEAQSLGLLKGAPPSFLQVSSGSRECPLCGAFDRCLEACATSRKEQKPDWSHPTSVEFSRFCMERCGNAWPGSEIPAEGFAGPEPPPPGEAAKSFFKKWSDFLR